MLNCCSNLKDIFENLCSLEFGSVLKRLIFSTAILFSHSLHGIKDFTPGDKYMVIRNIVFPQIEAQLDMLGRLILKARFICIFLCLNF